jgi:hypothetical protein
LGKGAIYACASSEKKWFIEHKVSTAPRSHQGSSGNEIRDGDTGVITT